MAARLSVLFCTPAYNGTVTTGFNNSLIQTMDILRSHGIESDCAFVTGDALVGRARNRLVAEFMATDFDHLFFIDADLTWDPVAPLKMVQKNKSLVLGLYPYKADVENYPVSFEVDIYGNAAMENGLLPLNHGPAGFMCIKRKMLQRMMDKFPGLKYDGGYNFFQTEVKNGIYWGEDTAFCELWRKISGSLWAMPDIDFLHVGQKAYKGNFIKFHEAKI